MKQLINAAKNGAEFLDEVFPYWWDLINTYELRLDKPEFCIIGQLGQYSGVRFWDIDNEEALEDLGFFVSSTYLSSMSYEKLTEAWLEEIELREHADVHGE